MTKPHSLTPPRKPHAPADGQAVTDTHWSVVYRLRSGPLTRQDWGPDEAGARAVFGRDTMPANVVWMRLERRQVTYQPWVQVTDRRATP